MSKKKALVGRIKIELAIALLAAVSCCVGVEKGGG